MSITPCRLVDTRPAPATVGTRATPRGPNETATFAVRGSNGNCVVPTGALSITANVTVANPTAASYLTMYPADVGRPNASVLNWPSGASPIANAVTIDLSSDGALKVFNESGEVNLIIDIVGYYTDHNHDDRYYTQTEVDSLLASNTATGPQGTKGDPGTNGADGTTLVDLLDLEGLACTTPVVSPGGSDTGVVAVAVEVSDNPTMSNGSYSYGVSVTCDVLWPDDGTSCDDGDSGTSGDQFTAGVCTGIPVVCNDDNPYTVDTFDGNVCSFTQQALDDDGDGYTAMQPTGGTPDCNDTNLAINPGALEVIDGLDNDCDGMVDET